MDDDLLLGLCSPLTRGLDWDTSFTSTVDVDAIKVLALIICIKNIILHPGVYIFL
jgi:hypothetical protein